MPAYVHTLNAELKAWLFDHALPLWSAVGIDRVRGGFAERIALDGRAVDGPRRVRVAARQTWVFATAGSLGWTGPWREAVVHGVQALEAFARSDGLFGILADTEGHLIDDTPAPYEQAFVLLALSAAQRVLGGDFEARAIRLRDRLRTSGIVRQDGGVLELDSLQANPMMHLFEAFQAWVRISDDPTWGTLAEAIATSALTRMIDPHTGGLSEQYDLDWTPRPGSDVEPGHQLEWGWLLLEHGAKKDTALRLIEIGETRGVERGVAIFSLDQDLSPRDRSARLWAQTERLHAHAVAGHWDDVPPAAEGLRQFLDVPILGTWRDRLLADAVFVEEAAPASSLYHVVSAVAALDCACRRGD